MMFDAKTLEGLGAIAICRRGSFCVRYPVGIYGKI